MSDTLIVDKFTEFDNFKGICYEFSIAEAYKDTRWYGFLHLVSGKCVYLPHVNSAKELEIEALRILKADAIVTLRGQMNELASRMYELEEL